MASIWKFVSRQIPPRKTNTHVRAWIRKLTNLSRELYPKPQEKTWKVNWIFTSGQSSSMCDIYGAKSGHPGKAHFQCLECFFILLIRSTTKLNWDCWRGFLRGVLVIIYHNSILENDWGTKAHPTWQSQFLLNEKTQYVQLFQFIPSQHTFSRQNVSTSCAVSGSSMKPPSC